MKEKVLFVCSQNYLRSPTAELEFKNDPLIWPRSAGTDADAICPVTVGLLQWADVVVCMERKHAKAVEKIFKHPCIRVLNVPDEYDFNDPALRSLLRHRVTELLVQQWRV